MPVLALISYSPIFDMKPWVEISFGTRTSSVLITQDFRGDSLFKTGVTHPENPNRLNGEHLIATIYTTTCIDDYYGILESSSP